MRELQELTWSEGTEAILALLPRLTVLRGILAAKPVRELKRCCEAIIEGNIRNAVEACFSMTGALLSGGFRRVSGDLFKDFLLHKLFLEPHPFARMAAENRIDDALYAGMKEDLELLSNLRQLDGETLYRFIQERYKELRQKARPNRDSAARLAEAAWGGSAVRPAQQENLIPLPSIPAFLPTGAPDWSYGEEELRDEYASDEALEEMYHRFLDPGHEWPLMLEDVWNFFASYGTGLFLKSRHFIWRRSGLFPMTETRLTESLPLMEQEYRECLNHAIEFMRGSVASPILITGGEGMGKTTMLFSLADELPELRFIYVPECRSAFDLAPLFHVLRSQPLKFMVAVDGGEVSGIAERTIPANVLLAAASLPGRSAGSFVKRVALPNLRLDGFADMVQRLLEADGVILPRETVRSACVDHQVDSKGELTVAAAVSVAKRLAGSVE